MSELVIIVSLPALVALMAVTFVLAMSGAQEASSVVSERVGSTTASSLAGKDDVTT